MTLGLAQSTHHWTDDDREIVRREYDGTNGKAHLIAGKLSYMTGERITLYAVKGQVQKLGLAQDKSPRWTDDEIDTLKEMITQYSPITIARRLGRSVNSVVVKSKRLHCSRRVRDGWFTKREVSEICGVDHRKVQRWMDTGALLATPHHEATPQKNGSACWHITEDAFKRFLLNHGMELQGRNVDVFTIIQVVTQRDEK